MANEYAETGIVSKLMVAFEEALAQPLVGIHC